MKTASSRGGKNDGFTLIELLMVVTVVGILVLLSIAAVQGSREASRKIQCADNLRQLGLGLQSFQASRGFFPPAAPDEDGSGMTAIPRLHSPHLLILPFVDQVAIYNATNFALRSDLASEPENQTVKTMRISCFLCPSDSSALLGGPTGPNSFRANLGATPYFWDQVPLLGLRFPGGGGGAFSIGKPTTPASFTDGLSQTVMMSEKSLGNGNDQVFDKKVDYWCLSVYPSLYPNADALAPLCQDVPSLDPPHVSLGGRTWYAAGFDSTWYNHAVTPNSATPGCKVNGSLPDPDSSGCFGGIFPSSSHHSNSVNSLMADGSVRPFLSTVDIKVWRALGTRAGNELP